MRILLDNNLRVRFGRELDPGHKVLHCRDLGWQSLKNGALVREADARFQAMLTIDKNMAFQTSLKGMGLTVIVLDAMNNGLSELRRFVPSIENALVHPVPGEYVWLRLPRSI